MLQTQFTIQRLFGATLAFAIATAIASYGIQWSYDTLACHAILFGITFPLLILSVIRVIDLPIVCMWGMLIAWPATLALWQLTAFQALVFNPFSFAVPAFNTMWTISLPILGVSIFMASLTPTMKRTVLVRCLLIFVGSIPVIGIAGLRQYEKSTWVSASCNLPGGSVAIDEREFQRSLRSLLKNSK